MTVVDRLNLILKNVSESSYYISYVKKSTWVNRELVETCFQEGFEPQIYTLDQWFPTTALGTTSAPLAVMKC